MTAHEIDNMASWFPESLSKVIPMRKPSQSKQTKQRNLVWMFSKEKFLFLNIILRLNFTREAKIVTLTNERARRCNFKNNKFAKENKLLE